MTEITVLAVTRLSSGVCVAGTTMDGAWARPTRPNAQGWRQLEYGDCKDKSGEWVVRKGNVVAMDLVKPIPNGAHTEDWLVGDRRPKLVKQLGEEEYRAVCDELTEDSTGPIEAADADRSLLMVHPEKITSFSFDIEKNWEGQKKYAPRCGFRLGGRLYSRVATSDAEWRGYGRGHRKSRGGDCRVAAKDIFGDLDTQDCWLTLGRNDVGSTTYLMVIGIHLFPVRHFAMDFKR